MDSKLIAKVLVPKINGKKAIGTAYTISKDLIITARHVVDFPERDTNKPICIVWTDIHKTDDAPYKDEVPQDNIVFNGGEKYDVALIHCTAPAQANNSLPKLSQRHPIEHEKWQSMGFPQIGQEDDGERHKVPAMGEIFPPDRCSPILDLETKGDAKEKAGWKGISGAPVFKKNTLIAVITHTPNDINERIRAISIPYLLENEENFRKAIGYQSNAATTQLPEVTPDDVNESVTLANFLEHWTNWSSSKLEFYDAGDLFSRDVQVKSPLEKDWQEFIQTQPWRTELLEAFNSYGEIIRNPGFDEMPSSLRDIKGSYEKVQKNLEAWIKSVKPIFDRLEASVKKTTRKKTIQMAHSKMQMPKHIADLKNILSFIDNLSNKLKAQLQISFLIFGAQGSGKTQFFRTRQSNINDFERGYDNHEFIPLLLPLEPWSIETSFEKVILTNVNEASGGYSWKNLDELDAFFSTNKLKLVVMIDDFGRVLQNSTMSQNVRNFMITYTKLDSIFYLFAVQDTQLDVIIENTDQKLWKLLSYDFKDTACMAGWVNLTDLNKQHKIGLEILKAADENETAKLLEKNENLDSPLLAQIVLELIQTENIDTIGSLNFFRFLDVFWKKLRIRENWDDTLVNELISCIIYAVFNSSSIKPPLNDIQKCLKEKNLYQSTDPFKCLKDIAIIRITSTYGDILCVHKSNNVQLNYTFFWNGFLAKQLWDRFNPVSPTKQEEAINWLQQVIKDKTISEGILEFVLLIADAKASNNTLNHKHAIKIWLLALNNQNFIRAPCFAARWASKYPQQAIARALSSGGRRIDFLERDALFALMFFAIETPTLDPQTRFKLLRPYYQDIHEMGLVDYLKYGASKILNGLNKKSVLYNCLLELANSHTTGCAREIASIAWDVFVNLHGNSVKDNLEVLMSCYLLKDNRGAIDEYKKWGGKGRRPRFFREEFIYQALYWSWRQSEIISISVFFSLLKDIGWYDGVSHNILDQISDEMRSEANLCFGTRFKCFMQEDNVEGIEEYKKLVSDLLNRQIQGLHNPQELGYFMLRFSGVEQEKGRETFIHPCLWDEFIVATKIQTLREFFERCPIKKLI